MEIMLSLHKKYGTTLSFADTLAKADKQPITGKSYFAYVTSFILGLVNVHCEKCFYTQLLEV